LDLKANSLFALENYLRSGTCKNMLLSFFHRVKIIIVVCLFISAALPTISHAFEMNSVEHCDEAESAASADQSSTGQSQTSLQADNEAAGHGIDNCDSCHSSCCNLKTLPRLSLVSPDSNVDTIAFAHVSEFLVGTSTSDLFRPPKFLV
jgi:hypothetical protein